MKNITEYSIIEALKSLNTVVNVVDQSHKHQAHYSGPKNGLTHIRLHIKKPAMFLDLTKVQQHQKIYSLLGSFIQQGLHAVEIIIED